MPGLFTCKGLKICTDTTEIQAGQQRTSTDSCPSQYSGIGLTETALYHHYFEFELPSAVLAKKRAKFKRKFADHKNLHRYFGICVI